MIKRSMSETGNQQIGNSRPIQIQSANYNPYKSNPAKSQHHNNFNNQNNNLNDRIALDMAIKNYAPNMDTNLGMNIRLCGLTNLMPNYLIELNSVRNNTN